MEVQIVRLLDEVCEPPRGEICIDLPQCPYFAGLMARTPIPRPKYVIRVSISKLHSK